MSTPPPGGPQAPQQPYPQQYPPAQPYYPQPMAPPPKKSNTALIIVLVVVVIIVVLAVVAWYAVTLLMSPVTNTQNITVTGVSFTILYPGGTQYFGASPVTSCSACPMHVTIYNQFTYTLTLTNSDSVAHNVTDISVTGYQFTLVGTNPTVPVAFGASGTSTATRSIVLTIQATPLSGTNTLTGTITTT